MPIRSRRSIPREIVTMADRQSDFESTESCRQFRPLIRGSLAVFDDRCFVPVVVTMYEYADRSFSIASAVVATCTIYSNNDRIIVGRVGLLGAGH